jgi:hypothetical protein
LAYLAACVPGPWTKDVLTKYVEQCERFPDPDAFQEAMKALAMRWSKPSRPLPYDITLAYQETARTKELDDHYALTEGHSSSAYPTFEEGIAIAWEAYKAECDRQHREPNRAYFEKWLNAETSPLS